MAKASYMLSSTNRWAVTGTPIVNKLEYSVLEMSSASQIKPYLYYNRDLYSLVHFLRIHPWCQYSFWKAFIAEPFSRKDVKALEVVQKVMEPIVLRRTKTMRDEKGDLIVKIPPKTVDIEYLDFSSDEREIYDALNTVTISTHEQFISTHEQFRIMSHVLHAIVLETRNL
jgi:DNA repair protein RAD5